MTDSGKLSLFNVNSTNNITAANGVIVGFYDVVI